jgi:lipoprotein NlpD
MSFLPNKVSQLSAVATAVFVALFLGACSTNPAPMESRQPVPNQDKVVIKDGVVARTPAGEPAAPEKATVLFHKVRPGETLYSIATSNGLSPQEVADWNNLADPTKIAVGQVLRLAAPEDYMVAQTTPLQPVAPTDNRSQTPGAVSSSPVNVRSVITEIPVSPDAPDAPISSTLPGKAVKEPYSKERLAALTPKVAVPEPETATVATPDVASSSSTATPAASGKINWIWPTQGKVVTRFSESASLKGIDIVGVIGQPILASAPGRVVYVGSGLRGYGKLVIVKHNDTFLSVYAHNRELYVNQGDAVKQGQKIAEMGNTDTDQVKLHFEVRQDGKPVDPLKFLPAAK